MAVAKFEIAGGETPEPTNYQDELCVLRKLIEVCEESPEDIIFNNFSTKDFNCVSTSWISWQLGIYAEQASEKSPRIALAAAILSTRAAVECRDWRRIIANQLTLANVLVTIDKEWAAEVCLQILNLPFEGGCSERGAAHVILAQTCVDDCAWAAAAHHYERAILMLGKSLAEEARRHLTLNVLVAYRKLDDLAGVIHCISHLTGSAPWAKLQPQLQNFNLSEILALQARLHILGDEEIATKAAVAWSQLQPRR